MLPGEYLLDGLDIELNPGRPVITLSVTNTGDRPIQIGAHYHFFETNRALVFDRIKAYGTRLDLPSGTSVRFEPGDTKEVKVIPYGGRRRTCPVRAVRDWIDLSFVTKASQASAGEASSLDPAGRRARRESGPEELGLSR